jgi:pimeloyl-ACP methyl ester carboxylesterase
MEPRIQYAKTTDGVNIAFWTLGEGQPLVQLPSLPWSHIQLEWQDPGRRRCYEGLAENRKLVRYDGRGSGLSDRNVADYSVDAHVLDLQAVLQRLDMQRFALLGSGNGGPIAIRVESRCPMAYPGISGTATGRLGAIHGGIGAYHVGMVDG